METADGPATPSTTSKSAAAIEALSKEELINKYKGLLGIAKKAKQAKDELFEENQKLLKKLLQSETQQNAMQEMLEEFTANKLAMATELNALQQKAREDDETLAELRIQNESLRRQLDRLNEDNDSLLGDIDRMESQLKSVNLLGMEQKEHLVLLELEVSKLQEAESQNASLQAELLAGHAEIKALKEAENAANKALSALEEKYLVVKEVNAEQRSKFNSLKNRFVEVHRKLRQLKECKRVLLETQHEYSEAVSKWQREIIRASRLLCAQMNMLKSENEELQQRLLRLQDKPGAQQEHINLENITCRLKDLHKLSVNATAEHKEMRLQLDTANEANMRLRAELADLAEQLHANGGKQSDLETQQLTEELKDLKTKLNDSEAKMLRLEELNDQLKTQTSNAIVCETRERQELQLLLENCEEEKCVLVEKLSALESERDDLLSKVSQIEESTTEKTVLQSKIEELSVKLVDSNQRCADLEVTHNEKEAQTMQINKRDALAPQQQKETECPSYEELLVSFQRKEREHADLLCEMRELNEALKARGDMISRQQAKQQELTAELNQTSARLKQIEDTLDEKEQFITEKDGQVHDISLEITAARSKVQQLESICGKNEEKVRLLTEQLEQLRHINANANANTESSTVGEDQSDVLSTSTFSRAEELNRLREVEENFEERYNKLRGMAVKLKKKLQDQTAHIATLEKQQTTNNTLSEELADCKRQLNDLAAEKQQQQQHIEALKAEMQKLKTSRKQANVLNLEIEAAERSLKETTEKLATKSSEVDALNETALTRESTIVQLRKELVILEAAKAAECEHARELKEQIDRLQTQIKDAVHGKQSALLEGKELDQANESLKLQLEELRLQLAQQTSTHNANVQEVRAEKERCEQQLLEADDALRTTQTKLKSAERALEDLRVEYLEYKVKAQAVLRKNRANDTSKEHELEEELIALRAVEKQLNTNAQMLAKSIEETDRRNALLEDDNENLQRRAKELLHLVEELRQQNDALAQENRAQLQLQQETLKHQRQQIESLDASHKEQLHELECSYMRQLEQLKSDLAKAKRLPPIIGAAAHANANVSGSVLMPLSMPSASADTQSKIDFLLMEREDAEGSEEAVALHANNVSMNMASRKISTASQRSQHDFMPLDELLNAPMTAISDTVTTTTGLDLSVSGNNDAYMRVDAAESGAHLLLQATMERLQIQESRVRHLTALLAENEQDLARLTQMNDMLKEELRRQERAVEREQHMHNSEYLKNVILKFFTLHSGDERMRLVPVLNTILKLSRSEMEILNCVAKGQKVNTEGNARSWGDFLTSWSGTSSSNNNNNKN